jgi:hypothetical protein
MEIRRFKAESLEIREAERKGNKLLKSIARHSNQNYSDDSTEEFPKGMDMKTQPISNVYMTVDDQFVSLTPTSSVKRTMAESKE